MKGNRVEQATLSAESGISRDPSLIAGSCTDVRTIAPPIAASHHHQIPWKRINAFAPCFGHNEGVPKEDAEIAVHRDRVRLGHEHHAGAKYLFECLAVNAVGEDMRPVGDEVDAVGMDRSRLPAFLAEEFSDRPYSLDMRTRPELGRHVPERRHRYLVPEPPDRIGRRAEADGRADLR